MKKVKILFKALAGNLLKVRVLWDMYVRKRVVLSEKQDINLVVSLTSYGHRARHSVQYTIYSLLKQTVRASHIVLWLAEDEFNKDEPLPYNLTFFQRFGLEVRFTEDMRVYKKLIPALRIFKDKNIITVDDDIYYSRHFIESLAELHYKNLRSVIATRARICNMSLPYESWIHADLSSKSVDSRMLCPLGFGGVLYPCGIFDMEVYNKDVFMKLSPYADDLWFFVQELRLGIEKVVLQKKICYWEMDLFRQKFARDRLFAVNVNKNKNANDEQFKALVEHYSLK